MAVSRHSCPCGPGRRSGSRPSHFRDYAAGRTHLLLGHFAAVATDTVDRVDHRLRDDLEQFSVASRGSEHYRKISAANGIDGVPKLVLAFITLTILPAIIIFVLAQRHIVAGLAAGAVKG